MILSMSDQTWLFLTTVAAGFAIGFVYDIFRIVRKTIPHNNFIVQLEDILYCVAVSLLMFYFMLHRNYGEIRFFSIAGAALGMVLYFCSLSPLIMKVSVTVIRFFQKVVIAVLNILLWPIKAIIKLLAIPVKWLFRGIFIFFRKKVKFVRKGVASRIKTARKNIFVMLKKV